MSAQLLVRLTKQNRSRELCSPTRRNTSKKEKTLLLFCPLLCFLLLLLSVSLLTPGEDNFCRKRLYTIVSLCFVTLVSTFPQICSVYQTDKIVKRSCACVVLTIPQICKSIGSVFVNTLYECNVNKVPGEIKRSRDLRGGRWSWTFRLAQKRS